MRRSVSHFTTGRCTCTTGRCTCSSISIFRRSLISRFSALRSGTCTRRSRGLPLQLKLQSQFQLPLVLFLLGNPIWFPSTILGQVLATARSPSTLPVPLAFTVASKYQSKDQSRYVSTGFRSSTCNTCSTYTGTPTRTLTLTPTSPCTWRSNPQRHPLVHDMTLFSTAPSATAIPHVVSSFVPMQESAWWKESAMRQEAISKCVLPLTWESHKGSSGRIGILGGSARYTGAPFYAGMASLKVGADLAFCFCADEACIPIKSYSPELVVIPVYNAADFDQLQQSGTTTDSPSAQ